jgi:hypothetical protein
VYFHDVETDLTSITFAVTSASFNTVLYVRNPDCSVAGTVARCNDGTGNLATVTIVDPTEGNYFAIVDGSSGLTGTFTLRVSGIVDLGGDCDPASTSFVCEAGTTCGGAGTCVPTACTDGLDNDADGDIDYPFDPGCLNISDVDETDPVPLPQCADGLDNDMDLLIDYGMDPGCEAASDGAELDECVPGAPVTVHPGGDLAGTTVGGSSLLGSPAGCGSTTTATTPEKVYFHEVVTDLASITFAITTATFNTVLYIRNPSCSVAGTAAQCNDGLLNTASVTIADPPLGQHFAIVDGSSGLTGTFNLRITGIIDLGGACDPASTSFVCETGTACGPAGTCVLAACTDGLDNDLDGDIDYPNDPGCLNISDGDETDPVPLPQCADGLDNDMDTFIDYPADTSCTAASDDNESCTFIETFESGVWPAAGWTAFAAGGTVTAAAAHDGAFGLNDPGWHYNTTTTFGAVGDKISVWGRPNGSTGRIYFGFSASSAGAKSLLLAPNTNTLTIQENVGYGFADVASVPQTYTIGSWYKLEVEYLPANAIIGRLFGADGTTLINSVSHTFATPPPIGGIAVRSFGSMNIDTFLLCD